MSQRSVTIFYAFLMNDWIFSRIGGGLEEFEAVGEGAILKDAMKILEDIGFVKIRDDGLQ